MLQNENLPIEKDQDASDVSTAVKIDLENKIIKKIREEVESENQIESKGRGPGGGHSKSSPGGGSHGRMRTENLLP